jgi:hypothetical protein
VPQILFAGGMQDGPINIRGRPISRPPNLISLGVFGMECFFPPPKSNQIDLGTDSTYEHQKVWSSFPRSEEESEFLKKNY